MSPAALRAVMGSCLALGAVDLAWLDLNAERMSSSASMVPIEPLAAVERLEPLPRVPPPSAVSDQALVPPPSPRSDEVFAPTMKPVSQPSPSRPERCVVHFDSGVALLTDDQATMLTPIADALKNHPQAVVRVDGHADRTGWKRKGSNLALSDERAAAIARALGALGIPKSRIRTAAFGDTRPVDDRSTEDALRRNRRAEVRIELTGDK